MSMDRGTLTRLSMQRLSKRFSRNKDYDKVDDMNDTRVPLHNEDAFQHGMKYKAKFIGSLEIARPQSKVDIITGMRRIRYEYKVKGIKKQRCVLDISTKGVRVSKRRRRKRKEENEDDLVMMQHPIYRIFYVSHDSQDLKIFSYITRESSDNTFQCNVFKAYKKRMALHVVRSLGQAFDVCHKQNPRPKKKRTSSATKDKTDEVNGKDEKSEEVKEPLQEEVTNDDDDKAATETTPTDDKKNVNETPPLMNFDPFAPLAPPPPAELQIAEINVPPLARQPYSSRPRPKPSQPTIQENPLTASNDSLGGAKNGFGSMSPSMSIGEPLVDTTDGGGATKNQWDVEKQQINDQMSLMKKQLENETTARIEAQSRVEHLLLQNKELLSHLQKLMVQLQQIQTFQMEQQKKEQQSSVTDPLPTIPDSTQTPPTTEPEDTSSEVTEQKTEDTSHDLSHDLSHDQANLSDDSSPSKVEQPAETKSNQSDIDFDEAFKTSSNTSQLFDDPFKPLPINDTPTLLDKEVLDAAFSPTAITSS